MKEIFLNGHVVDLILALVLIEALAILGWRFLKGCGPAPIPFIINLLAGVFLMLALREALVGASWAWIALCLIVALVAHMIDLIWRWEKANANLAAELGHSKANAGRRFF